MNSFTAKQEDSQDREDRRTIGVHGSGHGSPDTVVHQIRHRFTAAMHLQVFPDTVENNDSTVNRITYYS